MYSRPRLSLALSSSLASSFSSLFIWHPSRELSPIGVATSWRPAQIPRETNLPTAIPLEKIRREMRGQRVLKTVPTNGRTGDVTSSKTERNGQSRRERERRLFIFGSFILNYVSRLSCMCFVNQKKNAFHSEFRTLKKVFSHKFFLLRIAFASFLVNEILIAC